MFPGCAPMKQVLAGVVKNGPQGGASRRAGRGDVAIDGGSCGAAGAGGARRVMENAVQYESPVCLARPALVEMERGGFPVAGVSAAWRKLLLQAEMAGPHVQVAAIEGEPGSGKQTLARYLLGHSLLAGSPFRRRDAREWLLTDLDPGTMAGFTYLDRVDLLAGPGQGLLLSVLKGLQDRPLGKVLLVASSLTPLRQMAGQGLLMPDLAFRLTAVRLAIPPLRMRREDIGPVAQALLESICGRYQHRPVTLGPGALSKLLQHGWPGNVRELACVLEAALLETEDGVIRPGDLSFSGGEAGHAEPAGEAPPRELNLDETIRRHVQYVLDLNRGNKLRAARQLGISRSTLYRILGNEAVLSH
ncbi:sigma-54-dependent Fis family transcriptional regulator [Acidobacteria bacterium AB60]|nr:sigma-54-dependent Fis family transcriptional regulator [Acidobacteria bacterium AB60]